MSSRCVFVTALAVVSAAFGGVCTKAYAQITIPTVFVGDAGNAGGPGFGSFGAVSYTYRIGTYEVTAGQYTAFLNSVARSDPNSLYNPSMADTGASVGCGISRSGSSGSYTYTANPDFVNRPVNYVSFWDAARFSNWLHNGQPSGPQDASTTEDGAYTLTASSITTNTVTRNADWQWAVASNNEWHKAAYYRGGGTNAGYWSYPTQSNVQPGRDPNDPLGNNANWRPVPLLPNDPLQILPPYFTTPVGLFQRSASAYGTFDQGGNVSEWTETVLASTGPTVRLLRGGAFFNSPGSMLSNVLGNNFPAAEEAGTGFRVAQIPAPSATALLAVVALVGARRRR